MTNRVYVPVREGVYRHELLGAFTESEEEFGSYDGEQVEVRISAALAQELGFNERDGEDGWVPTVAYRHN